MWLTTAHAAKSTISGWAGADNVSLLLDKRRMMLGLQPPRYVVHPHYAEKLKKLLELTNDMEGGLPLEYDVKTLQVGHSIFTHSKTPLAVKMPAELCSALCATGSGVFSAHHFCREPQHNTTSCVCLMLLQEGQELELETGHIVRPFSTVHPVPSQVRHSSRRAAEWNAAGSH